MKHVTLRILCLSLLLGIAGTVSAEEPVATATDTVSLDSTGAAPAGQVIATYFHGNRRCATCQKLEAYAQEAITGGFAREMEQGILVWRVVNFDEEANAHYLKDYELFSQAVILSRVEGEKETTWRNLDQIWKLVGDKDKYVAYVRDELRAFLAGEKPIGEEPAEE